LIILTYAKSVELSQNLSKILRSLRQDILRPGLTKGRHVCCETETRSETFESETSKNRSRDY